MSAAMQAATGASSIVLEARGARVVRAGRALIDGVSLTAHAGEVLAVLGQNGAGKSTLLRLFAGDVLPDRGVVELAGRPISTWSDREQARMRAVLLQQATLSLPFTAFEVVLLGRSPHDGGHPGARDRAIAREALRRTDALRFADRRYPTLSGGERARVMLARVFAQVMRDGDDDAGPRALLLDEPSAALDVGHQHGAFSAIRALAEQEGTAVVAVVHDLNVAASFADRVALVKDGRVLAVGRTEETLTEASLGACFAVPVKRLSHPTRAAPLFVAVPD